MNVTHNTLICHWSDMYKLWDIVEHNFITIGSHDNARLLYIVAKCPEMAGTVGILALVPGDSTNVSEFSQTLRLELQMASVVPTINFHEKSISKQSNPGPF